MFISGQLYTSSVDSCVHQWIVVYISGQLCTSVDSCVHQWLVVYINEQLCTSVVCTSLDNDVHHFPVMFITGQWCTSLDNGIHHPISMNIVIEPTGIIMEVMINHILICYIF